jgi:hypothetical protein
MAQYSFIYFSECVPLSTHCVKSLFSSYFESASLLYSELTTARDGTGKPSLFIRPDCVMPSLLAFLLSVRKERFSHLAVDSFNAITDSTLSTDRRTGWVGYLPLCRMLGKACRTQRVSD